MLRSKKAGAMRWIALGLSASALAAVLLLTHYLSASPERGAATMSPAPATARAAPVAPAESGPQSSRREPMRAAAPDALEARVRTLAEALAQAMEAPEFEDTRWRAEVAGRARTLGHDALPALEALLADDSRSVEEHVAATELVAALKKP